MQAAFVLGLPTHCTGFPPVVISGTKLLISDGRDQKRFFAAGMVYSSPSMLSSFDAARFEQLAVATMANGGTMIRWNCFLKGLDLTFGDDGLVSGLHRGGLEAIRSGLDLAKKHGLLVQVVLVTAHFLFCGWGGCGAAVRGIDNQARVTANHAMLSTERGIVAYLDHVVDPLIEAVGPHEALFGFLIVNEGYSMVRAEENLFTYLSDKQLTLHELQ